MIFVVTENEGASVNEPDEVDKHDHTRDELRPYTQYGSVTYTLFGGLVLSVIFWPIWTRFVRYFVR